MGVDKAYVDSLRRRTIWPEVEIGPYAVREVIYQAQREGRVGFDCEFDPTTKRAHCIGVASRERLASCFWDQDIAKELAYGGVPISAYSCLGADRPVLEAMLQISTPRSLWRCPMHLWYCCHPDLASIPKAAFTEGDDSNASLGFMGLWACTSMLTDLPQWKRCIGAEQCLAERRPCPLHWEQGYCAVDALAGLWDDYILEAEMEALGVPWSYYEWRMKVSEYFIKVQDKGIPVDQEVIDKLEETITSKKLGLFPYELSYAGKARKKKVITWRALYANCEVLEVEKKSLAPKKLSDGSKRTAWKQKLTVSEVPGKPLKNPRKLWVGPFNPNSSKAVVAWFEARGIYLQERGGKASMGKLVLLKALEKGLKPYDLHFDATAGCLEGDQDADLVLPEATEMLLRLAEKTCAGKGLDSWFAKQYIFNGRVHSRFNATGTSTGRLASSKANMQNVPRVGFGAEVRKAVIAERGCTLLKADFSQLEFRMCLWLAGQDPSLADGAFDKLTEAGGQIFVDAAKLRAWKPRDVAKSAVHGGNYLEGLQLKSGEELSTARVASERKAKALLVYDGYELPEWKYKGKYITFTGANLAERLFGDRSFESRAKALAVQKIYFDAFPALRAWQIRETRSAELSGVVRLVNGHRMKLEGHKPENELKFLFATYGQGGGAIYSLETDLRFDQWIQQSAVHDEKIFCDIPATWSDEECLAFMQPMVEPSEILAGFTCPAEVSRGPNWKQVNKLGTVRCNLLPAPHVSTT